MAAFRPRLGYILGSGLQEVVESYEILAEIPYHRLAAFPVSEVAGHTGVLMACRLADTTVVILSGRAHFYEGYSAEEITFPVRILAQLGVRAILLTSAAGGINRRFRPGDFMVVTDHINFMGFNPLCGRRRAGEDQYVDLSRVYDARLLSLLRRAARQSGIRLRSGVYLGVAGPTYETPAEVRAFARWGEDAVGMSMVPEAIVARQCGLAVAGLSCITNRAAGRGSGELTHDDVLTQARRMTQTVVELLRGFAQLYRTTEAVLTG